MNLTDNDTLTTKANESAGPEGPGWYVYWGIPYNPLMQIYGVYILTFGCLGLLGNTLSILVFSRKEMVSSGTKMLFHLAIIDNVYIISIIILDGMMWLNPGTDMVDHVALVCQSLLGPIAHTAYTCDIYMTVALSIQRYVLVAQPLKAKSIITSRSTLFAMIGVYIFGIVFNIPNWIRSAPDAYWEPYLNKTWWRPREMEPAFAVFFNDYYRAYITLVIKCIIPLLILILTSTLIVISLSRRKVKSRSGQEAGNKLTVIVLAVTFMSLLTHTSTSVQWVLKQTIWKPCKTQCIVFGRIGNAFSVFNCVVNFSFYCAFGKKFRQTFFQIFRKMNSHSPFTVERS